MDSRPSGWPPPPHTAGPPAYAPEHPSASRPPIPAAGGHQMPPRTRVVLVAAAAVIAAAFGAGVAGVIVGTHVASPRMSPTAPAVGPATASPDEIRAETVDLCTRFATGIRAMPSPQKSALDVIPTIDYIAAALSDNLNANEEIRAAVVEDLRLARTQAAALSGEPPAGAIQPSGGWTAAAGNDADERVFKLCRAYQG